ncbi:MAG: zinc ribbon domain-containing protein [Candidatus Cloacimonadaceae bacterium]|nr:zinc ribbon domain-containing protein [Candidatus Cloacimonadaceae bacterium]MDP3113207.1 zinc ribbon domain-containing protein [Candidatus Cloacimonadaceae bacterium]
MHCSNCGQEINPQAVVCVHCGVRVQQVNSADGTIGGLGIICFLFPIVGLILYLVWKDAMPTKANGAGKAALWGFIISMVLSVLYFVVFAAAVAGSM